jgi:dCMP deaminase
MSDGHSDLVKSTKKFLAKEAENAEKKIERISWPEVWMTVARTVAMRSYDPRMKVGAVVVAEDNTGVLAVGYNGNARGLPNEVESLDAGQSGFLHAETNCLVKCPFHYPVAKHMYVTHAPCRMCAKLTINAAVTRVVYDIPYRDMSGVELLRSSGVEVLSFAEIILRPR